MLFDVALHQLFNLRWVDLAISAVTHLRNSLPEDLLVGFLVDLPCIVSWLQHELYFFHNTLLSLNFLQELLLDCHFNCRAGHIVDDLQLVVDHLRLHLLGGGSILDLWDPGRLPLVLGLSNNTLRSNDALPGA